MGKLSHEPQIHHFSHPHPLHLSSPPLQSPSCSACKLPLPTTTSGGTSADFIYTCTTCNFSLHVSCTQFAQLITHPSHLNHPLSLLPTSAYPEGHFKCDACKCRGNGFSYHCSQCNFDLHVICASKPLSATNSLHPHPLELTFSSPYEKNGFFCDICRKIGTEQWFYRCVPCEFDIHLECVNSPQPAVPPLLQHQRPLPVVSQNQNQNLYGNQNGLMHSASTGGGLQNNYSPVVAVGPIDSGGDNTGNGLANTGGLLQNNYPPAASAAGLGPLYNDGGNVNTMNTVMTAVAAPTPLHRHHHHHSLPSVLQNGNQISYGNQNHLMHSASTGGRLQNNYPPAASTSRVAPPPPTSRVAPPPPLQHHHSLPAISQNQNQIMYGNQNHLMHSASTGGRLQNNYPPAASASRVAPPPPLQHHHSLPVVSQNQNQIMYGNQNHLMHSASTGGRIQNYYPPAAAEVGTRYIGGHATTGNYLANTSGLIQGAVQEIGQKFVLGATQQLGESVMQSLIGAGDGGGDTVVNVLGGVLDGDTVVSVLGGALGSLC